MVCNQNPYKYTVVTTSANLSGIASLMSDYQRMIAGNYSSIPNDHFGLNASGGEKTQGRNRATSG